MQTFSEEHMICFILHVSPKSLRVCEPISRQYSAEVTEEN